MIALEEQLPVLYGADCRTRVQPILAEQYQSVIDNVWPLLPGGMDAPQLHVVHSPIARPTSVHGAGVRHLVYDQYLGQVFNRLTRIEFAEADSRVTYSYAFKLFGQRKLIRGDFHTAAAMAIASESMASQPEIQLALAESAAQLALRTRIAWMQECFAICHELVHVVIEDGNGNELRDAFEPVLYRHVDGISAAIESLTHGELRQYVARSLAADSAELAKRRGHTAHDEASFRLTGDDLDQDIRHFAAQLNYVRRPELAEEAMCDYFGAILAADYLESRGESRPLVCAAAALGLLHLRLFQYLDNVADPLESSQDDFEQAVLRASMLRTGLTMDLESRPGGDDLATEFKMLATGFNQAHSRIILDQVMTFDLARFAIDVAARASSPFEQAAARQMLGFGAVPRFTLEQAEMLMQHRNGMSRATIDGIINSTDG